MSDQQSPKKSFYFSTHDLLIMAVMAALGGVASTYINTLGDAVQAILGMPGGSQWAAGLHVLWIVLAMGITGKPGTGIIAGLLKGGVEILSGNSHGVIILFIDLVAGLLVDFGFLLFKDKRSILPYLIAGGLASGSNVLAFQIFATLPTNILAISAILILFFVALVSGIVFSGFIPYLLINALAKANIVKIPKQPTQSRKISWYILVSVLILAILLAVFLKMTFQGAQKIQISGAVENAYGFPGQDFNPELVNRQMEYKGTQTQYTGYLLSEAIDYAQPDENSDTVLIEASDGYAFLISFEELESNPNILAVKQGQGQSVSFDIVGPESSKAWVRGVTQITVIASDTLMVIDPTGTSHEFIPDDWLSEMDSTQIELPDGSQKLQGVPLWKIIETILADESPTEVHLISSEETLSISWSDIDGKDDLRLFMVIEEKNISYALAEMSGEVLIFPVIEIEID